MPSSDDVIDNEIYVVMLNAAPSSGNSYTKAALPRMIKALREKYEITRKTVDGRQSLS